MYTETDKRSSLEISILIHIKLEVHHEISENRKPEKIVKCNVFQFIYSQKVEIFNISRRRQYL